MDKMKLKPIKVLTKGTLDDYDKKELVLRLQALQNDSKSNEEFIKEQVLSYEKIISDLELKNKELLVRNEQLQKSMSLFTTDDFKKRMILRLYSQGRSIGNVHKFITENKQIDVEFEEVKYVIGALENGDLESEYQEYYLQEVKNSVKELPFSEELFRIQSLRTLDGFKITIEEYMARLKDYSFDEDESSKVQQILSLMDRYSKVVESSSKIMKGLNSNTVEVNVNDVKEMKEKLNEKANRVLKDFNPKENSMVVN